jgi:hypothetical protein
MRSLASIYRQSVPKRVCIDLTQDSDEEEAKTVPIDFDFDLTVGEDMSCSSQCPEKQSEKQPEKQPEWWEVHRPFLDSDSDDEWWEVFAYLD